MTNANILQRAFSAVAALAISTAIFVSCFAAPGAQAVSGLLA